ncbi:MAG: elongation factor P [Bacteroidetes bacterium]|jgi:elongation factor P|nr:elongation factor P [Bacteroidota bacterium]
MADTSDFRPGLNIVWKDGLWEIIDYLHVKPGKGGAFVRAKLKNVRDGQVQDTTFRAGEKIETARVERRPHQFLYEDDFGLHFMNTNTYAQFTLPPEKVDGREFIKEGGTVDILFYAENEEPLRTVLPAHVEAEVVQTDPGLRGDTATGATKPATIESGATVQVPLFINEGDVIRVSTSTGEYQERISMA